MATKTVTLGKKEYKELKEKAEISEGLLVKLINGLEDIKAGRTKPWKRSTSSA
jgi:PHD/YefM family antitoxin component YafN of YafNO toxin-antitoxin module